MIKLALQTLAAGAAGMCLALFGGAFLGLGGQPLGIAELSGGYTMIGFLVGGIDFHDLVDLISEGVIL